MKTRNKKLIFLCAFTFLIFTLIGLVGCSSPTPTSSTSGTTYPLNINWLDKTGQYTLDDQGRLKSTVQLSSADGNLGLLIYSGTRILDTSGKPLPVFKATIDTQPPMMQENGGMVGAVYDISPVGFKLNPASQITITYNPQELPAGANESDLYAVSYQDGNWTNTGYKRIDTAKHTITTSIDHSAKLAVLLPLKATTVSTTMASPVAPVNPNALKVVVAGTLTHGPMQPTIQAIKSVLAKYGDKVAVTWIDMSTRDGSAYASANNLTAHLNIVINGKYTYDVNGKNITFQWFEGQQWTKGDLDSVMSSLVSK